MLATPAINIEALLANVPLFNGTGWGSTTPSDTGWSDRKSVV